MRVWAGAAVTLVLVAGCAPAASTSESSPRSALTVTPAAPAGTPSTVPTSGAPVTGDRYLALARALRAKGVEVWFEADLVKAWLAGPQAFGAAVERLGHLATGVEVGGFKVADEIGYDDGLTSPARATAFLRDVRAALGRVAPGRPVLIDAVVPDLGCLPWRDEAGRECARRAKDRYPAASFDALSGYLRAGLVDRLDLSTGLLDEAAYEHRGTTLADAQKQAWQRVVDAGWDELTTLQSRKALAAAGGYSGDEAQARGDLNVFVDIPLDSGAHAVDVWTWRQTYRDAQVALLAPDLSVNPLWSGLQARHDRAAVLFTHMTPSNLPADTAGMERECAVVAEVFHAVFVAAGTG
jgi:hypothetical protein